MVVGKRGGGSLDYPQICLVSKNKREEGSNKRKKGGIDLLICFMTYLDFAFYTTIYLTII